MHNTSNDSTGSTSSTSSTSSADSAGSAGSAALAVTERLIFDVANRTGLGFGVVSNVLFAARALTADAATA